MMLLYIEEKKMNIQKRSRRLEGLVGSSVLPPEGSGRGVETFCLYCVILNSQFYWVYWVYLH